MTINLISQKQTNEIKMKFLAIISCLIFSMVIVETDAAPCLLLKNGCFRKCGGIGIAAGGGASIGIGGGAGGSAGANGQASAGDHSGGGGAGASAGAQANAGAHSGGGGAGANAGATAGAGAHGGVSGGLSIGIEGIGIRKRLGCCRRIC